MGIGLQREGVMELTQTRYEIERGIATVTLHRPEQMNGLTQITEARIAIECAAVLSAGCCEGACLRPGAVTLHLPLPQLVRWKRKKTGKHFRVKR